MLGARASLARLGQSRACSAGSVEHAAARLVQHAVPAAPIGGAACSRGARPSNAQRGLCVGVQALGHALPRACRALDAAVEGRMYAGGWRRMAIARDMTEDEYNNIANDLLNDILDKLEVIEDSMEGFEVNASGDGVIHIIIADKGTWVLNKQTPSRQIWLSSPVTGPTHYKMVDNQVRLRGVAGNIQQKS